MLSKGGRCELDDMFTLEEAEPKNRDSGQAPVCDGFYGWVMEKPPLEEAEPKNRDSGQA